MEAGAGGYHFAPGDDGIWPLRYSGHWEMVGHVGLRYTPTEQNPNNMLLRAWHIDWYPIRPIHFLRRRQIR